MFSVALFGAQSAKAQCAFGGTFYGNDITPTTVGQTVELLNYVWGGDQYTLNATGGCTYEITTCGGLLPWDTQITVFNGTIPIAYNDDDCGLQSTVTFTAPATGPLTVQINEFNCATNTTSLPYFGVTLVNCGTPPPPPVVTGCSGVSTDSGGTFGDYSNNELTTTTYCPDNAGDCIVLDFTSFDLENNFDDLFIYDGADATAPLIGQFTGTVSPGTVFATNGCLTLVFDSDGSVTREGWTANISCTPCGAIPSGCTDPAAENYDPSALIDDGSCSYTLIGVGCPEIDLGADIALPECFDPCSPVSVTADYFEVGEPTSYSVESIPYSPPFPTNTGTPFSISVDDVYTEAITLPFDFCFYGNTYNECVIGSNGVISFDVLTNAGNGCPWQFTETVPDPLLPRNAIYGVYHDIDPSVCGDARYAILGSAPCRVFVVNFTDICHYEDPFGFDPCNNLTSTTQIVLYETTNAIEVYVGNKPTCTTWNNGNAVLGLQDAAGTAGIVAPGRQTGPWTASNEAWRFTPNGPSIVEIDWFSQATGYLGSGETVDLCPTEATESFIAEARYTLCDGTTITVSDDIVVTCAQIFAPVEWLDFQATLINEEREVLCTWQTATELNNDYFTVERSADGISWQDIGTVAGAGTTTTPQAYQWVDHDPLPGVSYYRIRQTDYNGDEDHSVKRAVNRSMFTNAFEVYPNPGMGQFVVNGWSETAVLRVLDMRGREVRYARTGNQQVDLLDAAAGQYIFELQVSPFVEPRRVLVQVQH